MSGDDLPEGWAEATLTEVADLVRSTIDPQTQPDTSFNYVSLEWVGSGTGAEPPPHPTLGRDIGSSKLPFRAGDVLYGKLRPYLRKVFVATRDGVAVTDLVPLRAKPGVDPSFVKHFLLSPAHDDYVAPLMKGIGMPRLGVGDLEAMPFPVPPSEEQKRIVARLDALLARSRAAREALAEVPALLDTFRQSVLAAAFRGELTAAWRANNSDVEPASKLLERIRAERKTRWEKANPKKKYVEPESVDDPELPDLPEGWCWTTVDTLSSFVTDGEHATPERAREGVLLLSARNVHDGRLDLSKVDFISPATHATLCKRLKIRPGDVLLSCSGSVGRSCVVPTDLDFSLVRSVAVIRPSSVDGHYLSLALRSPQLQAQVEATKTQTAQANLFQGRIKVLKVPVAPEAERAEVVRILRFLMDRWAPLLEAERAATEELDTLDQSILARAFRGELVDQDPNDEPAGELLARIRRGNAPPAGGRARRTG